MPRYLPKKTFRYVHVLSRSKYYDYFKQLVIAHSPKWFVYLVRIISNPYALAKIKLDKHRKIKNFLPIPMGDIFISLYDDARKRWSAGNKNATGKSVTFPVLASKFNVSLRPGTCDIILYYDIMVQELYGKPSLNNVKIIVDCGANIGLASAYFLAKYPTSRVIGIEPDPINFILCKQNLNQFGNRVTLLNAAIWKAPGIVFLNENNLGTWASCVSAQMDESANRIQALDIFSILELYDIALIDILKIDIEGAELDIFSAENLSWLEKVRCVQIETKEEQARELFLKKLSNYGFKFSQFREIVIAEKQ